MEIQNMEIQNMDNYINSIKTGKLNIHDIDFIKTCLLLCRENDTDILNIFTNIKNSIEEYTNNIINENIEIKSIINKNINEWGLSINPYNIFDTEENIQNINNYNDFLHENMLFNNIIEKNKNLEMIIHDNNNILDDSIILNIYNLIDECNGSIETIRGQIKFFKYIIFMVNPSYDYLLFDLSNIKIENMNNIFLNYILIINFIKKEYHYLLCILESILEDLIKTLYNLNKLLQKI